MPRDRRDPARDPAYLQDMWDAATLIQQFVAGKSRDDYANDKLLRSAVERQVEIIGEAARNISSQTQHASPAIPWRPIQTQRHRLIHEYGEVNDELIWTVATVHIPALLSQLKPILERLS